MKKQVSIRIIFFVLAFFLIILGKSAQAQLSKNWVSYFGGYNTAVTASQYDSANNVLYLCGYTKDQNLGTPGVFKPQLLPSSSGQLNPDIFLAKFDMEGNLLWLTYFGGDSIEWYPHMALAPDGNIYLSGTTYSTTGVASPGAFMTSGPFINHHFVAKMSPSGQRLWATLIGTLNWSGPFNAGTTSGEAPLIAVDDVMNVYVWGATRSLDNIATPGAFQTSLDTATAAPLYNFYMGDCYLMKFSPSGQRLWGTYYGTAASEHPENISIDRDNNIVVSGMANQIRSQNDVFYATPGTFQNLPQGLSPAFVSKFNPSGQRIWSTYLSASSVIRPSKLAVDDSNQIYIGGFSNANIITTAGTHQTTFQGPSDMFLLKFTSNGQRIWGTFFGGTGQENSAVYNGLSNLYHGNSSLVVTIGPQGGIYLTGSTNSPNGIATDSCNMDLLGYKEGFIAKFRSNGSLSWGSYYDAQIMDISKGPGNTLFFSTHSPHDGLATPGAFMTTKSPNLNAGLFGSLHEGYVCPTDTLTLWRSGDSLITEGGYLSYEWYHSGNLVFTGTDSFYINNDTGSYYVVAHTDCNCSYTSNTLGATSINKVAGLEQLRVYPNPTGGTWRLSADARQPSVLDLQLVDLLGRIVWRGRKSLNSDNMEIDIPGENLASGVYLLRLANEHGSTSLKLIKN